jgi:hypothetical protein
VQNRDPADKDAETKTASTCRRTKITVAAPDPLGHCANISKESLPPPLEALDGFQEGRRPLSQEDRDASPENRRYLLRSQQGFA